MAAKIQALSVDPTLPESAQAAALAMRLQRMTKTSSLEELRQAVTDPESAPAKALAWIALAPWQVDLLGRDAVARGTCITAPKRGAAYCTVCGATWLLVGAKGASCPMTWRCSGSPEIVQEAAVVDLEPGEYPAWWNGPNETSTDEAPTPPSGDGDEVIVDHPTIEDAPADEREPETDVTPVVSQGDVDEDLMDLMLSDIEPTPQRPAPVADPAPAVEKAADFDEFATLDF